MSIPKINRASLAEMNQPPCLSTQNRRAVLELPVRTAHSPSEEICQPEGPEKPKGKKGSKVKAAPKTGKAKRGAPRSKAAVTEIEEAPLEPPKPSSPPHVREASADRVSSFRDPHCRAHGFWWFWWSYCICRPCGFTGCFGPDRLWGSSAIYMGLPTQILRFFISHLET